MESPDLHSTGFVAKEVDALRYESINGSVKEVAGMLRHAMPERCRVLDVGCGTGSLTAFVNEAKNNIVVGIEPDPDRAAAARQRGLEVHVGLLDAAFVAKHEPFDVVMLADVLEHVADNARFFNLCLSALKPQGLVLVSVPNVAHWTVRYDLFFGNFDYEESGIRDATHLRWFTEKTLTNFITRHRMDILSIDQTLGADLGDYYHRWPWKRLSYARRCAMLQFLGRLMPRLIGCQHIIVAQKRREP